MFDARVTDAGWLKRLRDRGFTADSVFEDGRYEHLKGILLSYGGSAVVLPFSEPDADSILGMGKVLSGELAIIEEGLANNCHLNSAVNFLERSFPIMTGYALSVDGAWRQHTWNLNPLGVIVETTEPRVGYFGFELSPREAREFAKNNLTD